MHEQCHRHRQMTIIRNLLAFAAGLLIVTITLSILHQHFDWTAGGWSAVGAWVAGIATSAAVITALWQSSRVERASNRSIQTSYDLHNRDLDDRRRTLQIESIAMIWDGIGESIGPVTDLKLKLERITRLTTEGDPEKAEYLTASTSALVEWLPHFQASTMRTILSFSTARMAISNPTLQAEIGKLERAFKHMLLQASLAVVSRNFTEVDKAKTSLLLMRDPLVRLANSTLAPPAQVRT